MPFLADDDVIVHGDAMSMIAFVIRISACDRLQSFSFHHLCYPNYGALTSTPAGLSPAEHASLRWTNNRTCGATASGPPTGFTGWHQGSDQTTPRLCHGGTSYLRP